MATVQKTVKVSGGNYTTVQQVFDNLLSITSSGDTLIVNIDAGVWGTVSTSTVLDNRTIRLIGSSSVNPAATVISGSYPFQFNGASNSGSIEFENMTLACTSVSGYIVLAANSNNFKVNLTWTNCRLKSQNTLFGYVAASNQFTGTLTFNSCTSTGGSPGDVVGDYTKNAINHHLLYIRSSVATNSVVFNNSTINFGATGADSKLYDTNGSAGISLTNSQLNKTVSAGTGQLIYANGAKIQSVSLNASQITATNSTGSSNYFLAGLSAGFGTISITNGSTIQNNGTDGVIGADWDTLTISDSTVSAENSLYYVVSNIVSGGAVTITDSTLRGPAPIKGSYSTVQLRYPTNIAHNFTITDNEFYSGNGGVKLWASSSMTAGTTVNVSRNYIEIDRNKAYESGETSADAIRIADISNDDMTPASRNALPPKVFGSTTVDDNIIVYTAESTTTGSAIMVRNCSSGNGESTTSIQRNKICNPTLMEDSRVAGPYGIYCSASYAVVKYNRILSKSGLTFVGCQFCDIEYNRTLALIQPSKGALSATTHGTEINTLPYTSDNTIKHNVICAMSNHLSYDAPTTIGYALYADNATDRETTPQRCHVDNNYYGYGSFAMANWAVPTGGDDTYKSQDLADLQSWWLTLRTNDPSTGDTSDPDRTWDNDNNSEDGTWDIFENYTDPTSSSFFKLKTRVLTPRYSLSPDRIGDTNTLHLSNTTPVEERNRFRSDAVVLTAIRPNFLTPTTVSWIFTEIVNPANTFTIITNENGVVSSSPMGNVLEGSLTELVIVLDRSKDYNVRALADGEEEFLNQDIDMQPRMFFSAHRELAQVVETPTGATVTREFPRWTETPTSTGATIVTQVYSEEQTSKKPVVVQSRSGATVYNT